MRHTRWHGLRKRLQRCTRQWRLPDGPMEYLNGMFSFVIFDTLSKQVFAARDRLGIKPLYYLKRNNFITISSEMAPLLNISNEYTFDIIGLRQYRKLRKCFNERTIYNNVSVVPAGHYMMNGVLKYLIPPSLVILNNKYRALSKFITFNYSQ